MPKANQNTNVTAMAFLNDARQYHEAAEELFRNKPSLTRVINALYFHVAELLFKAYLRAHGKNPWGHEIGELCKECCSLGLTISADHGLQNVVYLLESGNTDMGFRYFSLKSGSEPALSWTQEVIGQLMQVVAAFVESTNDSTASGKAVKLTMILGKPQDVQS